MRIRVLLAAVLFLVALALATSPAAAHHRYGHSGGPGASEKSEPSKHDGGSYGHGGGEEETNQGTGLVVSLAVIGAAVVLVAGIGLKPTAPAAAHG